MRDKNKSYLREGIITVILLSFMFLVNILQVRIALGIEIISGGTGALSLSKSEAFLNGDTIIITLIDSDLNVSSSADTGTVKLISSDTGSSGINLTMTENNSNSSTFLGTFITASSTNQNISPVQVKAIANGTIAVVYQDASPAADVTANVSTKNFGAVLDITADHVAIGGNAVVSLYDRKQMPRYLMQMLPM